MQPAGLRMTSTQRESEYILYQRSWRRGATGRLRPRLQRLSKESLQNTMGLPIGIAKNCEIRLISAVIDSTTQHPPLRELETPPHHVLAFPHLAMWSVDPVTENEKEGWVARENWRLKQNGLSCTENRLMVSLQISLQLTRADTIVQDWWNMSRAAMENWIRQSCYGFLDTIEMVRNLVWGRQAVPDNPARSGRPPNVVTH